MKKLQVEGWKVEKLGDVVEFQRGLTYSKKDEVAESSNVVLRANNVDLNTNTLDFTELKYIKESIEIPKEKIVTKGSLIICTASGSKSHLGKVALIDDNYGYAFGGFMGQITPKQNLDSKFLFYRMISDEYKDFISKLSDGANINNLRFNDLAEFEIPIPPLPEQQRIVSLLDEIFAGLAQVHANAERNLVNAREVFESELNDIFSKLGKEWEVCSLDKYIKFIDYRGHTPTKTQSGMRLITAKNVKLGFLQKTPEEFVDPKIYDKWMVRGFPKKGDVLFTTEAPLANVAQLDTDEKVLFAQRIIILQPMEKIDQTFLKYMLLSKPIRQKIFSKGTGATVQGIKARLLKTIEIYAPPLEEQRAIVKRLDGLAAETSRLEAVYQSKLEAVEELKKSVLGKAFEGEL